MPDAPKSPRPPRSTKLTTPEEYPAAPPQPSGDYSYTLEIVMNMQHSMGKLSEAVEGLKSSSRDHGAKLDALSKDVHAGKVALYAVGAVVGAVFTATCAFVAFAVNTYLSFHKH